MKEQKPILTVRDLVVKFRVRNKELTAIRSVGLDLYDGETLAIVGESGSGKTVLTKTFTGMLESNGRIDKGSIEFEGRSLVDIKSDRDWEAIRGAKISTVFQDPMTSLNPLKKIGLQITEVIEKHQKLPADQSKKIALELMSRVGIKDVEKRFYDYPFQYSGGMRQRIVIAIALACRPKILICDEPTTALDVTVRGQILDLLDRLQQDGVLPEGVDGLYMMAFRKRIIEQSVQVQRAHARDGLAGSGVFELGDEIGGEAHAVSPRCRPARTAAAAASGLTVRARFSGLRSAPGK